MKRYIFFVFFLIITPLANAQTLNVFPQVADGVFGDGGYYKTTFMILPGYDTSSPTITCTLVLYGLGVNLDRQRVAKYADYFKQHGEFPAYASGKDLLKPA